MRFRFNPGGASNSLPLWENNSCFLFSFVLFVVLFFFFGGGGQVTQVLGYNTVN